MTRTQCLLVTVYFFIVDRLVWADHFFFFKKRNLNKVVSSNKLHDFFLNLPVDPCKENPRKWRGRKPRGKPIRQRGPAIALGKKKCSQKSKNFISVCRTSLLISSRCCSAAVFLFVLRGVRPGYLFGLLLSFLLPLPNPQIDRASQDCSPKARHEADIFVSAKWSERLTPGRSGWPGAAAAGSIPALAISYSHKKSKNYLSFLLKVWQREETEKEKIGDDGCKSTQFSLTSMHDTSLWRSKHLWLRKKMGWVSFCWTEQVLP